MPASSSRSADRPRPSPWPRRPRRPGRRPGRPPPAMPRGCVVVHVPLPARSCLPGTLRIAGPARAAALGFFRGCLRRRNAYVTMRFGMHRRPSTAARPCLTIARAQWPSARTTRGRYAQTFRKTYDSGLPLGHSIRRSTRPLPVARWNRTVSVTARSPGMLALGALFTCTAPGRAITV